MKKIYSLLGILFFAANVLAQNVGIGTPTPTTKLEVFNPLKSTIKIASNSFNDTSEVVFSNRNVANQGTTMQLTSIRENGIRVSSKSDLTANNVDTIMQITPDGKVGIRTATPNYPLDVKGDANITGSLRANGNAGSDGQYLRSSGNGTMTWSDVGEFKNILSSMNFNTSSTTVNSNNLNFTWTVPADVTTIYLECWGGGGGGGNITSGAGGGYIASKINVTPGTTANIVVGSGGIKAFVIISGYTNSVQGGTTSFTYNSKTYTAQGGNGGIVGDYFGNNLLIFPPLGGIFSTSTNSFPETVLGFNGNPANPNKVKFVQVSPTEFAKQYLFGSGGDTPFVENSGGFGGLYLNSTIYDEDIRATAGVQFGGGGGADRGGGAPGKGGRIIIHY